MPTLVRNTGVVGVPGNYERNSAGGRNAHCASDGSAILVIADSNDASTQFSGYGDQSGTSKIYVYSSTDRVTWTLRTTYNTAVPLAKPNQWTSELYSDNSIGIVYEGNDGSLRFNKVTRSSWAVGGTSIPLAASGTVTPAYFDLHISDGDVPSIAVVKHATTGTTRSVLQLLCQRTSDSTWVSACTTTLLTSATPDPWNVVASVSILKGGTSTARNVALMGGSGVAATGDNGVTLYTTVLNESSGAASAPVSRLQISAGDIKINHGLVGFVHKGRVFTDATNQFVLGVVSCRTNTGAGGGRSVVGRFSWDGSTFGTIVPLSSQVHPTAFNPILGQEITYGTGGMIFHSSIDSVPQDSKYDYIEYVAKFNADNTVTWGGHYKWANLSFPGYHSVHMLGNGQRNPGFDTHDTIYHVVISNTAYKMFHHYLSPTRAPAAASPAAGATIRTSLPAITADAKTDIKYSQSAYKMVWQFASDSGFTTNLREYEQPNSKYASVLNTDVAATSVRFTDIMPSNLSLPQGVWYMRVAQVDMTGKRGAWLATQSFTVSHQPTANNLQPALDKVLKSGLASNFTWAFSDESADDFQTAFQVVVTRVSDGASVYDSGKITGDPGKLKTHSTTIASTYKDAQLRWTVRLWDRDDVAGPYAAAATFYIGDPPTLAFVSPTPGTNLSTGNPNVQLSGSVGAGRVAKLYKIIVLAGDTPIYDSGWDPAGDQQGAFTISDAVPTGYLMNNMSYTFQAYVIDSAAMQSDVATTNVTTTWITPAAPTSVSVDNSKYNVEDQAYNAVTWTDAARDPDFIAWVIYRKDDMLNPDTQTVVETGTWKIIGYDPTINSVYTYQDSYAPAGYSVSYRVTQLVDRYGDRVESSNTSGVSVFTMSDGYWLINPDTPTSPYSAMRLSSVSGDSYTDEYEEEEYVISGRGRHIDRGEHLGVKGTLECKLRTNTVSTARQKKRKIETMKANNFAVYLRTPFGDVYRIAAGNISVTRIAGVGRNEYCDMSIPYSEVGA